MCEFCVEGYVDTQMFVKNGRFFQFNPVFKNLCENVRKLCVTKFVSGNKITAKRERERERDRSERRRLFG